MKIKKGEILNPTGKGGFGDNPQNRANGRWNKENSISYQYNRFLNMTVKEFNEWVEQTEEEGKTMAEELASRNMARSTTELNSLREVTDRTEGKPQVFSDVTSGGENIRTVMFDFQLPDDIDEDGNRRIEK